MMKQKLFLLICLCMVGAVSPAQQATVNPDLLNQAWPAQWITCPGISQRSYGIYHFRKKIQLNSKPNRFIIHLTADNRYRFFVNGKAVCFGPAQGDLYNWYFETIDIAPFLKEGENSLAALVWNMGEYAGVAQVSNQTGFLLQGDGQAERTVNTDTSWNVFNDTAYQPCSLNNGPLLKTYYALGPGDHFKSTNYPWGWEQTGYDDRHWPHAVKIASAAVPAGYGTDNRWTLSPRPIPLMEETFQRISTIRRFTGIDQVKPFITGKAPLLVPAGKKISILLDQSFNTVAFPELLVSRGKGATIKISYAEALFRNREKGNRNEIEGKEILGNYDLFEPDGQEKRLFRPLCQRSFRYIQLDITTGEEPLLLEDFYGMYTGYPLQEKARFTSSDSSLQEIWNVGWRTARLCAGETYYDCPYYEQLQYVGDTRIQSLISLYVSGDDRLMKKAIHDFYNSRVPEGLTQGRYPSNRLQVIPPFSLYWVSMLYDFMMHRNDDRFLQQYLDAAAGVLSWYEKHLDRNKSMLGPMKWWNFTDWTAPFIGMGVPPGATDGNSALLTLHYAYTLQQAAELFRHFGKQAEAQRYAQLAANISKATYLHCFNAKKGLLGDTPEQQSFSQHTNIMGVLSGAFKTTDQQQVINKILQDSALAQASFYYRFYLVQALKKANRGDLYYSQLTPWRQMLKAGLTTFAETPDPSRSDCHAWSASPNYDFLATLCGITPASAGFKTVQVKPDMGALAFVSGTMPSPAGDITVTVNRQVKNGATAMVQLPTGVSGTLVWKNKTYALKQGKNEYVLPE